MAYPYETVPQSEADLDDTLVQAQAELREKEYQRQRLEARLDPHAIYPNHIVESEQLIVNEDFIDRASFTASQRKALRSSILDAEVIKSMTDLEAERAASKNGSTKQIMMFILAIIVNSFASTLDEWGMTDPVTGKKRRDYIPRMPSIVSYMGSSIFATVSSPILYGQADLASLWDFSAIFSYLPIALAYCINDVVNLKAVQDIGASAWKVMGQAKLMMTAVGAWLFMRRDLTATQWLLLTTVSFSIAAYSILGLRDIAITNYSSLITGFGAMILTTAAGLMCEAFLKKEKGHFIVQFGRTRICGLFCAIPMLLYEINKAQSWHLFPLRNWDLGIWTLVLDDIARCWATTLIVKQLDSVWKTLAGALSLNFTYLLNIWLNPSNNKFDKIQFITIMAIATDIVAFASSKQDEQKILQLAADAERKALSQNNA